MNLLARIIGKFLKHLERWCGFTHLNPLATLYVNLRVLPFSEAMHFPIYAYGWPRLVDLSGRIRFTCPVRRGLVRLNVVDFAPSQRGSALELAMQGDIVFGGRALVRSNTKIYVDHGACLTIGDNLRMGAGIIINCLNRIEIGEGVRIGHRSQLLDSNLHYMLDMNRGRVPSLRKRITVGAHSWLTNSVTVYGGAVVPPYSVVVSGSVINKDLSDMGQDCILGGMPCRVISRGFRLVNNYAKERELDRYYRENPDGDYPVESPLNEDDWFVNK
jgi:acetyltransferase-like isoleucine patch superfamily enzyme